MLGPLLCVAVFLSVVDFGKQETLESCESPDKKGVSKLIIKADSPIGPINIYTIQFDIKRKLSITSTAIHNELNQKQIFNRKEKYRILNCTGLVPFEMKCTRAFKFTPEQKNKSGFAAWDRGHLVPANSNRFSEEALSDTFYCPNMAPQEPYTNRRPWQFVESLTLRYFKKFPGFVITGVCDADNPDGVTKKGYSSPSCYWKLVCYKEGGTGSTEVVGFIVDNSLVNKKDKKGRAKRWRETTTPRSQADVEKLVRKVYIKNAWNDAAALLLNGRNEDNTPSPASCFEKKTISEKIFKNWHRAKATDPGR